MPESLYVTREPRLSRYDMTCIDRVLFYIDQHYRDALSPEHLSIEGDLNIKKLRAGIRRRTGHSLHEYHFKVRIEKAKLLLLQTGYPLKHIANAVGFKNESHFCQKFRKFVSVTPNEFRYT
jgi:YesN/AraC family two-component response regulator